MAKVRTVIREGLKQRAEAGIKVRQPLQTVQVGNSYYDLFDRSENRNYLIYVACEELNVKVLGVDGEIGDEDIVLDTKISPELALEGEAREIIRAIQEGRKKAGFEVNDRITLGIVGKEKVFDGDIKEGLSGFGDEIAHETLATEIIRGDIADADYRDTTDIEGEPFTFLLKCIK